MQDLLSLWRVYLKWQLHIGPFSVSSQVCWQPPLPWLQVTMVTCNKKTLHQRQVWTFESVLTLCWLAHTDAVSLVAGQLKPWTTLASHTPFRCLFADLGAAMLLIHTVETIWDRKRASVTQWKSLQWVSGDAQRDTYKEFSLASSKSLIVLTPSTIQKHQAPS